MEKMLNVLKGATNVIESYGDIIVRCDIQQNIVRGYCAYITTVKNQEFRVHANGNIEIVTD